MRGRLARAAYEVIAERGHSAFRTAAVAERAGVSQGARAHHFATKDSLTLAAVEHAFATALARSRALASRSRSPDEDPIALMLEDFQQFFTGEEFWVGLDVTISASKDSALAPEIGPIVAGLRGPVYRQWIDILVERGWSPGDAETVVRMTAALVAGFGMRSLWEDVESYLPAILAKWREIIRCQFPTDRQP